jgi:Flp pilus assembly pilin Flp
MKRTLLALWREDDGILSFEWTMVLTLLVIGIVAGLAAARDAIIDELGDVAQAAGAIDQSFSLAEINIVDPPIFAPGMSFTDDTMVYTDCARELAPAGQAAQNDSDS